ncbi:30S ribosomal protein S17 [Candidatus Uhrbacteria bacterium RIFCSPHIGHO2_12_FULL_57_11]|uniref:Small ribosomal subunit protein uS17 n=2 Tax=Candidatus Uhriibacteriota TaxID=1752732 RepID=A0A1F7ULE9_9BACT|nr:MAG: 30S ribosomal protein S17 [Candidatus Uhrbacteria bacterium RIFCSPHIGHO2_02_FULL_57_19]OGL78538.1 MAG: 30S ribosomal protein S17 [Candidatus Uhrbacteria bacterium RIFCSPHIGHO2_12_FULL_57_11]
MNTEKANLKAADASARRRLQGVVVSDKMSKTVIVRVDRTATHPMYRKQYRVSRRYKAHDEENAYHSGDVVTIEETRPVSRDKRWRVVSKVSKN